MNDKLKTNITALADKAEKSGDSGDAMRYAQAALNLAHVLATLVNAEK